MDSKQDVWNSYLKTMRSKWADQVRSPEFKAALNQQLVFPPHPLPELHAVGNPQVSTSPGEALCPKELERELVEMGKCENHPFLFCVSSCTIYEPEVIPWPQGNLLEPKL